MTRPSVRSEVEVEVELIELPDPRAGGVLGLPWHHSHGPCHLTSCRSGRTQNHLYSLPIARNLDVSTTNWPSVSIMIAV